MTTLLHCTLCLHGAAANSDHTITNVDVEEKEETIVSGTTKTFLNLSNFSSRDGPKNFIILRLNLSNIDIYTTEKARIRINKNCKLKEDRNIKEIGGGYCSSPSGIFG